MEGVIDLQLWQLAASYVFIVILLFIVKARGISREKEIIVSSIRMTLQLILTGYLLVYLFNNSNPLYTLLVIAIMEVFAIYNIIKRSKFKLSKGLKRIVAISMLFGTLSSILYFLFVVVNISPWYNPRYFIPIAGMLIGNSMTGISLGVTRLVDGMYTKRYLVESALMLGATPKGASKEIVDNAFDSAILPTINSMVGMGIVFLPGMMTGQILSGTSPVTSIKYQIAIMLGILGSVALTVIIFLHLGYKTFFNDESQLNIGE
ncbi:iron export ABC transporter permease subunit FetB [Alkaliphilus pronyensis]|uniref:Iron export ABC transporter permease subunit FetB n=1 Tax=Alkaliphilus pronyensis TaxID=1482732 RepID=A0A6I0FBE0_9FIRM|nr:iron export ABC transporter permease subunit FetB [Alkaliphilus pronyensis]KAB3529293.1 iron export ABC transporter permease subunit FetB [Alkaliphilus pronyensis]